MRSQARDMHQHFRDSYRQEYRDEIRGAMRDMRQALREAFRDRVRFTVRKDPRRSRSIAEKAIAVFACSAVSLYVGVLTRLQPLEVLHDRSTAPASVEILPPAPVVHDAGAQREAAAQFGAGATCLAGVLR